jgi:hypothetical protein
MLRAEKEAGFIELLRTKGCADNPVNPEILKILLQTKNSVNSAHIL